MAMYVTEPSDVLTLRKWLAMKLARASDDSNP
jgi:hypothetical protein